MVLVLTAEVDDDVVDPTVGGPLEPVLKTGSQIAHPESIQQGRIDLTDLVVVAVVHSRDHPGLGVELLALDGTVQDQLERALHELGCRAVELVEQQHAGLTHRLHVPRRRHELGSTRNDGTVFGLDRVEQLRQTQEVTFGHLRQPQVDHWDVEFLTQGLRHGAFADTVWPPDQDRLLRRKSLHNLTQDCDVDVGHGSPSVGVSCRGCFGRLSCGFFRRFVSTSYHRRPRFTRLLSQHNKKSSTVYVSIHWSMCCHVIDTIKYTPVATWAIYTSRAPTRRLERLYTLVNGTLYRREKSFQTSRVVSHKYSHNGVNPGKRWYC